MNGNKIFWLGGAITFLIWYKKTPTFLKAKFYSKLKWDQDQRSLEKFFGIKIKFVSTAKVF